MQQIQDILINCSPRETRVAILVDGVLEDLHIERAASRGLVGNVYVGKEEAEQLAESIVYRA